MAALRYAMGIMSSPDPRFGARILATQGNTSLEGCTLLGWAAAAYRHTDPALSAECQWMWDADGRLTAYSGSSELIRTDLPMRPPALASAWYRGFGVVLRRPRLSSCATATRSRRRPRWRSSPTAPAALVVGRTLVLDGRPAGRVGKPRFTVALDAGPHAFRVEQSGLRGVGLRSLPPAVGRME
jgi:hypothetical protein